MFEPPEFTLTHQLAINFTSIYKYSFPQTKALQLTINYLVANLLRIKIYTRFLLKLQASLEETGLCHQEMNFQGTFEYEFKFKILPF
jgi:hypothetical protein